MDEDELETPPLLSQAGDGGRSVSRNRDLAARRVWFGLAVAALVGAAIFLIARRPAAAPAEGRGSEVRGAELRTTGPRGALPLTDLAQQEVVSVWSGTIKNRYGVCLDAGKSPSNGHEVRMRTCFMDTKTQQWVHDATTGLLKNVHGICLDSPESGKNGSQVHMWQCYPKAASQQWEYDRRTGRIKSRSGSCLDAPAPKEDSSKIQMWSCDSSRSRFQSWNLEYDAVQGQDGGADRPVPSGEIRSRHGLCLVATGASRNGAGVRIEACHPGSTNQMWSHDPASGLLRVQSGICLDAPDPNKQGGRVHLWKCFASLESQQWELDRKTGLIKNRNGVCLDAPMFTEPGSELRLWACDPSLKSQQWSQAVPLRSSARGPAPRIALSAAIAAAVAAGMAAIIRA